MVEEGICMARLSIAALALVACNSGAKEKPVPPPTTERIHLYADEELDKLERALTERLAANWSRTCPRPVLRGTATIGPPTLELLALTEPKGPIADCLSAVGESDAAATAKAKECGPTFEAAIAPIGLHEDGCSPFQPGRHVMFETAKQMLHAADILAIHAKGRAAKDPKGALWLLADSLRAFQDLARGHVDIVAAQTATAAYKVLLPEVAAIVASGTLAAKDAGELATAFEALVVAEPRWGDALQGQLDHVALYQGAARLQAAGWAPPGGTTDKLTAEGQKKLVANGKMFARDEAGLAMQTSIERAKDFARECTPTTGYTACIAYLEMIAKERARLTQNEQAVADPDAYYATLRGSGKSDEEAGVALREVALETAAVPLHFDYADHGRTKARAVWGLVAAAHALHVRATGKCDAPPSKAGIDLLGEPSLTKLAAGVLEIAPPAIATSTDTAPWKVGCK
jgi:hypothetical protein